MRTSLQRALQLGGYRVPAVPDGAQALSVARRLDPDLLILDVMMPGVGGIGACRVLRARRCSHPNLADRVHAG